MDPNVLGGLVEGTLGLLGGIVVTVFAFKVRPGKSGENGKIEMPSKINGHCKDHRALAADVKETKEIAIETKTDVKWLVAAVRNGNGPDA